MTVRTCPDWPDLMELAAELQFKHYTVAEAKLPSEVLQQLTHTSLSEVAICCDLDRHVFNADHTEAEVGEALRASHWFELRDWASGGHGRSEA